MSAKIRVLPDHLINQIAAGEVVEDAASAVKELVENALDAGAQRIVVSLEEGGYRQLSVVDDGIGMSGDDAILCFERHATSKIRAPEDLAKLYTMGFRGEALAALASVSKITLTTALEGAEERGTRVEIAGGRLLQSAPCGRSRGTSIEVSNLFYNAPARRKFQPSKAASERAVTRIMNAFSLGYPHVEFVLQIEGKQALYAKCCQDAEKRAQEILGENELLFEQPVRAGEREYSLEGFLSPPHLHRAQRSGQYLFVDGRHVAAPIVSRAVREAYSTRLPQGRHPSFVLYLRCPPGEVDANVHPQKTEVRFGDEQFLYRFVGEAVRKSLLSGECSPMRVQESALLPVSVPWEMQESPASVRDPVEESPMQMELPCTISRVEIIGLFEKYLIVSASSLPPTAPLFFGKKQEGLVIVDLSLARMKMAFQEILSQKPQPFSQRLLIPRKIQLQKPEAARLRNNLANLLQVGVEVQALGEREFLIEGMPLFWEFDEVEEALMASIEEIEKETLDTDMLRRLALRVSSYARWNKGGETEAKALLEMLLTTVDPYFSPRGKPIMALLQERDLERLFMRS